MRRVSKLLGSTSVAMIDACKTFKDIAKPVGNFSVFTTAAGRFCAITRDAIDKGLPQAAGIRIIDGDKAEGEGIRDVEPAGNA